MKIDIITCHNIKNYGSVLQTYATQTILQRLGHDAEFIDYQRPGTSEQEFKHTVLSESNLAKKKFIGKMMPLILAPSFKKMNNVFNTFLKNNICLTENTYYSSEDIIRNMPQADVYASGSDQIWNSSINRRIEKTYLLDFVPDNVPKISISSSFGKQNLDDYEIPVMKRYLFRYMNISVREKSGLHILQSLGITNGYFSIDPTFFLKENEWMKIREPSKHPKKYILVYQLHRNKELDGYVKRLEKYYGISCLRVTLYYHYILKGEKIVVSPTPGQWIDLISNATYVVTDSFHMTAFSIMFHKKFVSFFSEGQYNGRIDNILQTTGLLDRKINDSYNMKLLDNEIDYSNADLVIEEKRKNAIEWLKKVLSQCEENIEC